MVCGTDATAVAVSVFGLATSVDVAAVAPVPVLLVSWFPTPS